MVATVILERDENRDLHDQEGHLRNAAGQRIMGIRVDTEPPMEMDIGKGDTVKRQENFIKGKGDEALKYHVKAIIEDGFWQVIS
uniref:Uncharacterized protein n=1 Tax=Brassica oleracea TaxID=3712 RepID=A0A3P6D9T4_BRAOL|nr:unnamed protein product [Brassica oleracea]